MAAETANNYFRNKENNNKNSNIMLLYWYFAVHSIHFTEWSKKINNYVLVINS